MTIEQEYQEEINDENINLYNSLLRAASPDRMGAYLLSAGGDHKRALDLYIWNAKLCGAFYLPLQATEISLRNGINNALISKYGNNWWVRGDSFWAFADEPAKNRLSQIFKRLDDMGKSHTTPQIVASLSFGFWVHLLDSYYNVELWSHELETQFPHLPNKPQKRENLKTRAAKTLDLRNRIFHHEPIHRQNISLEYSQVMELLSWVCPDKRAWIKSECEVPKIMRQKP